MKEAVFGVILAGGNAARMGQEKTLAPLSGRPVLAHVIARFAPQVAALALNANGDATRFAAFGLPVFDDGLALKAERQGPVAGLLAALAQARAQGYTLLATVPGDAPFLPEQLVLHLQQGFGARDLVCLASQQGQTEPLFGLWRCAALEPVQAAFAAGERSLHRVAALLPATSASFDLPQDADAFCNLNTPLDLAEAQARVLARAAG